MVNVEMNGMEFHLHACKKLFHVQNMRLLYSKIMIQYIMIIKLNKTLKSKNTPSLIHHFVEVAKNSCRHSTLPSFFDQSDLNAFGVTITTS